MIQKKINKIRKQFKNYDIDGYVVPKNDEFFSEYSNKDRLKFISNFSGSAGYAVILKKKCYLFVDGRYSIQAKNECGKNFKIVDYSKIINTSVFRNLTLGVDPTLFTSNQVKRFFLKNNKVTFIENNLIDNIFKFQNKKKLPFYSLNKKITGESHVRKISKVLSYLKKYNCDYMLVTAPENIAWLLNIRGHDNPTSPIPNSFLIISKKKKIFLIVEKYKTKRLVREKKLNIKQIIAPKNISNFLNNLDTGNILIDEKTCSIFLEKILTKRFNIIKQEDPIYFLKSIKNNIEINNMIKTHIIDGVALTKFIYWLKNKTKLNLTEVDAQNKLENFRKKNSKYLFPSFQTIAGSGKNGAIVHYRAKKKNTKLLKKNEIFLCDSGGQYKFGTTDVTRTICFNNQNKKIKNIFTNVLKGHIAVVKTDLNKKKTGKLIDIEARKFLKKNGLNYNHGTGHGVGFFLNVHEGPQAISKQNSVKIQSGMILSNEPGYYKQGKFGIRIENLVYACKVGKNLIFKNLTLAPIEKDLINYNLLTKKERNYIFEYHLEVYSKLSPYLSKKEKRWLASFI
ncbi:M24 family metallopeptidase [Candidatus Pelagibacter sp.]|uniref:M24 family metallopeptidase n=1 Tax=Candidatus Pelagibacter sp. TaxID=2024849 RepID=UPI003F862814